MRFRERALALLDTVEAAERDLVSEPDTLSGLIRVAVPTLLAEYGLIERLGALLRSHSEFAVTELSGRFECNDSRVLVAALHGGLGIGLRPRGELRAASGRERLVHVLPDYHLPPLVLRAATPSRRHDRRRLDKLVELFHEVLRSAE